MYWIFLHRLETNAILSAKCTIEDKCIIQDVGICIEMCDCLKFVMKMKLTKTWSFFVEMSPFLI